MTNSNNISYLIIIKSYAYLVYLNVLCNLFTVMEYSQVTFTRFEMKN